VDSAERARRQIDWPIWVDPCIVYPGGEEKVGPAQRARPNAIIIVSDALRLDHLPCYGYKRDTAPNICKLAGQGTVCFNVFTQAPWTKPAIGSIFTGLYPYEHGALLAVDVPQYRELPQLAFLSDDLQTMAEVFKESGYKTAGFSANVHLLRKLGFSQGFDYWQETEGLSSIEMMKDVLRWIERNRGSPFFIYIHLMDTHSPYYSFPPFRGMFKGCPPGLTDRPLTDKDRSFLKEAKIDDASMHSLSDVINRYDDCIYQTDSQIGELMRCLRNDGVLDTTFIAITADHGEALSERGDYFHGWTLYNEVLRVPLVLFYPKLIPPGSKLEPVLENRDIFSTFADLLNLAVQDPRKAKERSWRSLFKGGREKRGGTAYSETEVAVLKKPEQVRSALSCIQDGRWKLIHDARTGEYELYNLESDPGETVNVYARYPEVADSYRGILDKWGEVHLRTMEGKQLPVDEFSGVVRQRLKALGYLQ
jgi:arylsulfatase A-like enzyme